MPEQDIKDTQQAAIRFGRRGDWIITGFIVAIAVGFIVMLQPLQVRAKFYPWFITISILLVGAVYAITKIRKPAIWDALYDPTIQNEKTATDTGPAYLLPNLPAVLRVFAIFLALVLASIAFGPKVAVPVYVTLALWLNGENKVVAVLSGLGFWVVVHFVFGEAMSINLPMGAVQEYLK